MTTTVGPIPTIVCIDCESAGGGGGGGGSDGGGGGGGGGGGDVTIATFGATGTPIRVSDFSNSGAKQHAITNVLKKIFNGLSSYADCANWLQGGGVPGSDLIQALLDNNSHGYGIFNVNTVAAFAGQKNADGSSAGVPETAAFTVNANGAFFNSTTPDGKRFFVGTLGYVGNTLRGDATILIHELAHTLGAAGFQSDFGNDKAGAANDKLVDKNCGKLIGGLR